MLTGRALMSDVKEWQPAGTPRPVDAWLEWMHVAMVAGEYDGITGTVTAETPLVAMPWDARVALGEALVSAFDLRCVDEIAVAAGAAWVEGLVVL